MGTYWKVSCPYCMRELACGRGYGGDLPDLWVPFIRCNYCGNLIKTGGREYLTIPVSERITLHGAKVIGRDCEHLKMSLDRTNNQEYISFLKKNGYNIYPITEEDIDAFPSVDFALYQKYPRSSASAIQLLYKVGIFINEEERDEKTGNMKKEVYEKNARQYDTTHKSLAWGAGIGLFVGIILTAAFASVDPNSYLFLIGIAIGIAVWFVSSILLEKYYKKRDNECSQNNSSRNNSNETSTPKHSAVTNPSKDISCKPIRVTTAAYSEYSLGSKYYHQTYGLGVVVGIGIGYIDVKFENNNSK